MSALALAAALSSAMPMSPVPVFAAQGAAGPRVDGNETSTVLAFSEDGIRALVQENLVADDGGGYVLRYVVLGARGRELVVDVSDYVAARGLVQERISRDDCRQAAARLEDALRGFRAVKVRASGCSTMSAMRVIVEVRQTIPPPVASIDELNRLQQRGGLPGFYFVSEDGPLVVVIVAQPGLGAGAHVVERTFLRSDLRLNKRWPDPVLQPPTAP